MCLQKAATLEPNDKGELTLSVLYWGMCVCGGGVKIIPAIQDFEANFLWEVSLKIHN